MNFTVGGTAAFGTDYAQSGAASFGSSSGTVTFAAGTATAAVTLDPVADTDIEANETVVLTWPGGRLRRRHRRSATGTIDDDNVGVTVGVSPSSVAEDGTGTMAYIFRRDRVLPAPLTVSFAVGGTATFATDYAQSGRGQLRLDFRHGDLRRRQRPRPPSSVDPSRTARPSPTRPS